MFLNIKDQILQKNMKTVLLINFGAAEIYFPAQKLTLF